MSRRAAATLVALALSACTPSSPNATTSPTDSGTPTPHVDAGPDGAAAPVPTCYTNPQTYVQIINACTDAQAIDKTVDLSPMNLPDGALRPLP